MEHGTCQNIGALTSVSLMTLQSPLHCDWDKQADKVFFYHMKEEGDQKKALFPGVDQ